MIVYNSEWAQDTKFNKFWNSYSACEKWRKANFVISKKAENLVAGPSSSRSAVTMNNPKERPKQRGAKMEIDKRDPEVQIEECMSKEMQDFMEITANHRRERDEKRALEKDAERRKRGWMEEDTEEYINIDKINIRGREQRTTKPKDEQAATIEKRENARKLYGEENASKILAMETVLDLQFEKEYTEYNPQMWPNIPFRF